MRGLVRQTLVVVRPPGFASLFGLPMDSNQCTFRHSSRSDPVSDSIKQLSVALPGWMKSIATRCVKLQMQPDTACGPQSGPHLSSASHDVSCRTQKGPLNFLSADGLFEVTDDDVDDVYALEHAGPPMWKSWFRSPSTLSRRCVYRPWRSGPWQTWPRERSVFEPARLTTRFRRPEVAPCGYELQTPFSPTGLNPPPSCLYLT